MDNIRLNTKLIRSLGSVLFMHTADMMVATSIASTTWYSIMQNPENITIQQLLSIANGLHIPVRRFFSADKPDVIGQRDDYVTEPYQPCQYDTTVLQAVINNKSATWQQAAKAAGMSRDNLRKSMLAVRRTPVTRFLTVCGALNIDPFSILIDPYRVRVFFNGVTINSTYRISDEDAKAFMAAEKDPKRQQQLFYLFAIKYVREKDGNRIRQDLRYEDIFDYDSRKEKSGLAKEIAKGVRSVERATPGNIAHANAVSRQLCFTAYMLRSALTKQGGSSDYNREDELRKGRGYEDEIEAESQLSY